MGEQWVRGDVLDSAVDAGEVGMPFSKWVVAEVLSTLSRVRQCIEFLHRRRVMGLMYSFLKWTAMVKNRRELEHWGGNGGELEELLCGLGGRISSQDHRGPPPG